MKIKISTQNYSVEARLLDTPTGKAIYKTLPFESRINTWGDEIYFKVPLQIELEPEAQAEVEIGDLAYWPDMPAFCIFFGPTPVSSGHKPRAAGKVNVFGKLKKVDLPALQSIKNGIMRIDKI